MSEQNEYSRTESKVCIARYCKDSERKECDEEREYFRRGALIRFMCAQGLFSLSLQHFISSTKLRGVLSKLYQFPSIINHQFTSRVSNPDKGLFSLLYVKKHSQIMHATTTCLTCSIIYRYRLLFVWRSLIISDHTSHTASSGSLSLMGPTSREMPK